MILRTAAQQALQAMLDFPDDISDEMFAAIDALKAALAQEQAEPVAWLQPKTMDAHLRPDLGYEACSSADYGAFPVYRAPPKAEQAQEPVAVVGTQVDVWRGCDGRWAPPGGPIKTALMLTDMPVGTMLYTAPPCCDRGGANCHPPALLRAARQVLEAIDAALPQAPHCGEFDHLADAAADLTAALAEAQASSAAGQPAKPAQAPADTTRLSSDRVAVVDEAIEWRPISYCPPRRKVLLLTDGGVAVLGAWDGASTWAIAWAPLPVIPAWLRERLAPVAVRLEQDVTLGVPT